jgi:MFS family permease
MAGETISMLGTWMQMMAQGWVVAGLTASAFTLGLMNLASGLPMLILTTWGGVLADRLDKRKILLSTQVVQIAVAAWIGWLVLRHTVTVWHIIVAGFILGVSTAFEMPSAAALVPELVEREQLRAAIAVDRSIFHATRLAGPAIGGVLISLLGTASAFFANAASFIAMIVALFTLPARPAGTAEEEAQRQTGMHEGWVYVKNDPPTRTMLMLLASITTCISPFFMIMMPLYSRHILQIPASEHGILMGSSGLGAFAGSIWLLRIAVHHRVAYMRGAIVAVVLCMAGLAVAQNLAEAIVAMALLTAGTSTIFGLANTIVQERAPNAIRGRVSAVAGMSFFGVMPFSGLIMTKISDEVGMRQAMGGSSVCFGLLATLLLYRHHCACAKPPPVSEPVVMANAE